MVFSKELIQEIRAEFPRVEVDWRGRRRIFFDNAAGTMVLERVARAETLARINKAANECDCETPTTVYDESRDFDELVLVGRKAVQDLLNAPSPDTITIGPSTTDLLFKLAYAIGKELTGKENIVTTDNEHLANVAPWEELRERRLVTEVRYVCINKKDGTLDMDHFKSLVDKKTKVISVTGTSNLTGTKSPLEDIAKIARGTDTYFIIDGTQRVPHSAVDVQKLNCDFLVFTGYKIFTSAGAFIYGKKGLFKKLKIYDLFGHGLPYGTLDQAKFASIEAVVQYLVWLSHQVSDTHKNAFKEYSGRVRNVKIAMDAIEKYERELSRAMLAGNDEVPGLAKMPHVTVYGIADVKRLDERDPAFAFKVRNMKDYDVAKYLWEKHNVAVRLGDLWNKAVKTLGVQTAVRASLVHYNTVEEVYAFLKGLNELGKK